MKKTTRLKKLILDDEILILPGAYDALTAKIIERAGFEALGMSGAAVSASLLGAPDLGLISFYEMLNQARYIAGAVNIPVLADIDTGFGNLLNTERAIIEFEASGVAGIHIEDQVFPKKCGHFEGKQVIPASEMIRKIEICCATRKDPDFVIVARTDTRAVDGLEAAIERGNAYAKAGADVIFVEAPKSIEELELIPKRIDAPLWVNLSEGGKTPQLPPKQFEKMGYQIAGYPGSASKTVIKAVTEVMEGIHRSGSVLPFLDRMVTLNERSEFLGLRRYESLEKG